MNERILIVDDTPANIQTLSGILKEKGYQLSVATNGKQALQVLEKVRPDLILLDVMMPEMDGFETCRQIKKSETLNDIPIIFLTAKTDTADIVSGFEIGAVDYVAKPFNPSELLARINTHLTIDQLRRSLAEKNEELARAQKREREMAYRVQSQLIPLTMPEIPGWEFAAHWQPAREVSGDFYDFIRNNQCHDVIIADVSGKGMPAALFMASIRSIVRAKATASLSPAESLTQANALICADAARGMYVTVFYVEINAETQVLTYVNAGHNPPFWYKGSERQIHELAPSGPVVGLIPTMQCVQQQIKVNHGDLIMMYTDGFTEAFNEEEQEFGDERLKEILLKNAERSPKDVLAEIQSATSAFVGSAPQSDDRTIVIAKYL
ncbi:MAG TPA: SpoIIE family protein phosphatase [Acidobacteriota bacterium]